MTDDLDFEGFLSSPFCRKGSLSMTRPRFEPLFRNNGVIQFESTVFTKHDVSKIVMNQFVNGKDSPNIWPALYYNLLAAQTIGPFKTLIQNQWTETLDVISKIDAQSVSSFFLIIKPGGGLSKHIHSPKIKQTITFKYNFDFLDMNSKVEKSYVKLFEEEQTQIMFDETLDKVIFTMLDNTPHEAMCKNLSFFWIYDFEEYIEFPTNHDFRIGEFHNVQEITY
jgi:hypothetical protein